MKLAITGSSSGIGYALAVSLLNEGHEVWGIARSTQLELSKTFPKTFHSSICDVSDLNDLQVVVNSMSKFQNLF
jgi:NADP-dependent 3-hydroxy acid dehydrogenase YdfG